jgi:glycosyltransferase involved in cell wall biosynthesis
MSTPREPTISAVVRVYNGEAYIAETVAALLAQTRPADEVVIVDDGSTDGTPDVLAGFGDAIRVVRQPNSGLAAAFNRCFAEARGDYVAVCDADDIWVPERLERQCAVLERHPDVDFLFGAVSIFGTSEGDWGFPEGQATGLLEGREFAKTLFAVNVISTSTTLIRRSLHAKVGPFEEHMAEDFDFWLRCAGSGALFYWDPVELARYRRHDEQVTNSMLRVQRALHEVRALRAGLVGDKRLVDATLGANLFKIGRLLVDGGQSREASAAFREAARRRGPAQARALLWIAVLALPNALRRQLSNTFVNMSRRLDAVRGGRPSTLP